MLNYNVITYDLWNLENNFNNFLSSSKIFNFEYYY